MKRSSRRYSVGKNQQFTYKDASVLKRFVTEQGAIIPRSDTGLTRSKQIELTRAVKRARHLAMLPFTQTVR